MGSSGGGDDGMAAMMAMRAATPMPGLPIAGADSTTGDPYEYGKFQNFLPDVQAEGKNPSATGLRPEMFQYKKPSGVVDPEIEKLRNELAALKGSSAAPAGGGNSQWAALRAQMSPQDLQIFQSQVSPAEFAAFMGATSGGGGGGVGTMGLGGGGVGTMGLGGGGQQNFQQPGVNIPINWLNSNNPNVSS
jgi:hypothetical protein